MPVNTAFTYGIPTALLGHAAIGMRVKVSFRGRLETGFVVEVSQAPPAGLGRILPIAEIIGREAHFPAELIALARWISDFYSSSVGEVLAAMSPPAAKRKGHSRITYALAVSPQRAVEEASKLGARARRQAELLRLFANKPAMTDLDMAKISKGARAAANALVQKGVLVCEGSEAMPEVWCTGHDEGKRFPKPTEPQQQAIREITAATESGSFSTFLLWGVTGSGKTEVYLRAISAVVESGGQAIVLVPEISLTPQTIARFQSRFPRLAVLHSAMAAGTRSSQWELCLKGKADVVIGARSAVFAPLPNLKLIVIDEEHEPSYKQDNAPRYSAREVAVMRANLKGAVVVLGSATPSLESWHNARTGKYRLLELPDRVGGGVIPVAEIVDMKAERSEMKKAVAISRTLKTAMIESLSSGRQVLLFLNRRGYHVFGRCAECGGVLTCLHCDVSMTHHRRENAVVCHYCGYRTPPPIKCPECGASALVYGGMGTEKIEDILATIFPEVRVGRMDADTTSARGSHAEILGAFRRGDIQVLLGTQMVAKGLDYPNITTVGVLDADVSLMHPDFRASERTFQLLAQVAGRAGRGEFKGRVIIQTSMPGNFAIQSGAKQDFKGFAERELESRLQYGYPPYVRLCRIVARSESESSARDYLKAVVGLLAEPVSRFDVRLLGPVAAPVSRTEGKYRFHILLKAASHRPLLECCSVLRNFSRPPGDVSVAVDMNPMSML
ncbi:MAG: primosomal protein N' [Candidatus Brocadiia bacterium]